MTITQRMNIYDNGDDVYKAFIMYSGVNLIGGFYGDEISSEIGADGGRVLSGENTWELANETILDGSSANSYHVVWFGSNGYKNINYNVLSGISIPKELDERTILDGFTITGGFANIDSKIENTTNAKKKFMHLIGGGAAIGGNGEIQNCIVSNNKAKFGGGGMALFDGAIAKNCWINNNETVGANLKFSGVLGYGTKDFWRADGAGIIALGYNNEVLIENSSISNNLCKANDNYPNEPSTTNNKTNNGGGVFLSKATLLNCKVFDNEIVKNPSSYAGGSKASCGGAVYVYSKGIIDNCEIYDNGFVNNDYQNGAGIYMADYESLASNQRDLLIKNSFIHSNREGVAIGIDSRFSSVENSVIANNSGVGLHGYSNCKNNLTVNCVIYNNAGNGWSQTSNANNSKNKIINSTIVRNNGRGISIQNDNNNHEIINCVDWANKTNSSFKNSKISYSAFSYTPPAGTGNIQISADNMDENGPKFINPISNYTQNLSDWQDADWNISDDSPLIDMGNKTSIPSINTTDIANNDRIMGCNVDIWCV
ncbi:MAG: right-handed parallel beta-helix repeat-containing protein [Bacteroidales bacterium]|nr:right-handed parallel beta-helix repeat-containing protein [Bacteroidales bacterium]